MAEVRREARDGRALVQAARSHIVDALVVGAEKIPGRQFSNSRPGRSHQTWLYQGGGR